MNLHNNFGLSLDYLENFFCNDNQFLCSRAKICINTIYQCDGIYDCPSLEDENCQHYQNRFECMSSNQTISYSSICDYYEDCQDGSDEIFCGIK